jgi:glycosyltransferase involved in cell wall biosynthesis
MAVSANDNSVPLRISVVMATFNGMPFLPEQLTSILTQSIPVDEIIIRDDGSADGSWEYLREQAVRHSHIDLLRNPQRLGAAQNFGQAISRATGDIIFLSDQDDIWAPKKVERMSEFMALSQATLVMSNGQLVDVQGRVLPRTLWQANRIDGETKKLLESNRAFEKLASKPYITGCAIGFSRRLLPLCTPIPPGVWHDEWMSLVATFYFPGSLRFLDEALVSYRQHRSNLIGARVSLSWKHPIRSIHRYMQRVLTEIESSKHLPEEMSMLESRPQLLSMMNNIEGEPLLCAAREALAMRTEHVRKRLNYVNGSAPLMSPFLSLRRNEYRRFSNGFRTIVRDLLARNFRDRNSAYL